MTTETLKDVFSWLERSFPDKEAIADSGGRSWTFGQLNDYSRRVCASYAQLANVDQGDRVGWLSLEPSASLLAISFGARKMGAVPVIMNSRASPERIAWMINNVELKVLTYSSDCRDLLERVRSVGIPSVHQFVAMQEPANIDGEVLLDDVFREFANSDEPRVNVTPDDLCFISYTSGTTGIPKPVMHLEDEWSWTTVMMAHVLGLSHQDVSLVTMPPSFVGWAHVTCASLRVGAKQGALRFQASRFLEALVRERGTHAFLSPTLIRMLFAQYQQRDGPWRTDSLRVCALGGEPVTADVLHMFQEMFPDVDLISSLGATEGILLHSGVGNRYITDHFGAIGKPLPGVTIELRDEDNADVISGAGQRGVLYARGPGIAAGIWNDPEATARNFPGGWWRTGDMLERDQEGYYAFVGRSDHMFKSGNIKIHAEDVEQKLKSNATILDAVVVPVADATFGFVPFAHIRHLTPVSAEALEEWWLEASFERHIRPRYWKFWGEGPFPMVTDVKIDRRALAELANSIVEAPTT
jgi:acyl-coenzyme A synthetase/AMP-(fatty) acid ligase